MHLLMPGCVDVKVQILGSKQLAVPGLQASQQQWTSSSGAVSSQTQGRMDIPYCQLIDGVAKSKNLFFLENFKYIEAF